MEASGYFREEWEKLEAKAKEDEHRAERLEEELPSAAEYYRRRARWRHYLALDAKSRMQAALEDEKD